MALQVSEAFVGNVEQLALTAFADSVGSMVRRACGVNLQPVDLGAHQDQLVRGVSVVVWA